METLTAKDRAMALFFAVNIAAGDSGEFSPEEKMKFRTHLTIMLAEAEALVGGSKQG